MPYPPLRNVPGWVQNNVRIGHLPGFNARMVSEFLKAGYNVVTVNCLGKKKRMGQREGRRSDWKKAYVTLKPGEKIDMFEGA